MTNQSDEAADAQPPQAPRQKKRRPKKRRPAGQEGSLPSAGAPASEPLVRAAAFGLLALACAGFYVFAHPGAETRSYALIGSGVASFLFAASPGMSPQRVVLLMAALVAAGLAVIGARASEIGTVLAMLGGLGLGGAIHRLGRLGPDDGRDSTAAVTRPAD